MLLTTFKIPIALSYSSVKAFTVYFRSFTSNKIKQKHMNCVAFGPQVNNTERATAAFGEASTEFCG
jgi:hypothetical protein